MKIFIWSWDAPLLHQLSSFARIKKHDKKNKNYGINGEKESHPELLSDDAEPGWQSRCLNSPVKIIYEKKQVGFKLV